MIENFIQEYPVVQGLIGAAIYGSSVFLKRRSDPENPEKFDAFSWGTTVAFGAVFGLVLMGLGMEPTFSNIEYLITSYIGLVVVTESAIKALLNGNKKRAKKKGNQAFSEAIKATMSLGTSREQVKDSVDEGMTEEEMDEEWDQEYPDYETWAQEDEGEGEQEGELPPG